MAGMSAGRPVEGAKPKQRASITTDPDEWKQYKKLVAAKLPPGTSVSSHLQELVRKDIAKLKGEKPSQTVDVASLQKQHKYYRNRLIAIQKGIEKRDGAKVRFTTLLNAYCVNKDFSNVKDVIRQALQDQNRKGSPVQEFLDGHPETDLSLVISVLEIRAEMDKTTRQMLEAHEAQYLATPAPTQEQALKEEQREEQEET